MKSERTVPYSRLSATQRWMIYALIPSTTLILMLNAYNSGILKAPIFVAISSLLAATFLAGLFLRGKFEWEFSHVEVAAGALTALCLISALASEYPVYSWPACLLWVGYLIMFFAGSYLFTEKNHIQTLIRVIAIVSTIVAVVGIIQYFFADRIRLEFYLDERKRIGSTLGNPAFLGGYIVLVIPLLLSQVLARTRFSHLNLILVISLLFVLILTQSRSSLIGFALSVPLFFFLCGSSPRKIIIWTIAIGALGGATALLFAPNLVDRLTGIFAMDASSSFARRLFFWEAGLRAFLSSPIYGHGIGTYEIVVSRFRSSEYWTVKSEDIVPHAHNELLEIASDFGIIGILLVLFLFIEVLRRGSVVAINGGGWKRITAAGFVCSLIAIAVDNLSNVSLREPQVGAIAWLIAGGLSSSVFGGQKTRRFSLSVPRHPAIATAPLAIWLVTMIFYGEQQLNRIQSDSHTIQGLLAGAQDDSRTAVHALEKAASLDPDNLLALSNLGLELIKENRFEQALLSIGYLQSVSPDYPRSNLMKAVALMGCTRLQEAHESIARELHFRTHPETYYIQTLVRAGLKDTLGEKSSLVNLLQSSIKGRIPFQLQYASSRLLDLTQPDENGELLHLLEELNAVFPGEETVLLTLALVYHTTGDSSRADRLLQELHSSGNKSPK